MAVLGIRAPASKESAEREGRYGKRATQVAARTVLVQHPEKGRPNGR